MKCYEGSILTVNAGNDVFRYLVEDKGRIVYVGDTLPEAYAGAEKVDLGKRALIPSFAELLERRAKEMIKAQAAK